jgi:hypothetical protein
MNIGYKDARSDVQTMFHVLLYLVTGVLAGVVLMRWWQARAEAKREAKSATHTDPARTLADAVLAVALLTLRKEDVAKEGEIVGPEGLRLPTPSDIVSFMSEGGAHTAAVRRYLEQQFPSIHDVGAFVMEIEAILSAFTQNRAKSVIAMQSESDVESETEEDKDVTPETREEEGLATKDDTACEEPAEEQ